MCLSSSLWPLLEAPAGALKRADRKALLRKARQDQRTRGKETEEKEGKEARRVCKMLAERTLNRLS